MNAIARLCLALTLGMSVLPLSGCSSSVEVDATTVGQELQDLEDARDKGLITEAEYNKQRQDILNRK